MESTAVSKPPRRDRLTWTVIVATTVAFMLLAAAERADDYGHIDESERARLQQQASVVAENLARQFEGVNSALLGVRTELEAIGLGGARQLTDRMIAITEASPGIRSIHILDASGTVLASSRDAQSIGRDFSQRDLFADPKRAPDAGTLYVSGPYLSQREGVVLINVGRALTRPDGSLLGVVTAALDPSYFSVVLRSVLYAQDMRTSITHDTGRLFISEPPNERTVNRDVLREGGSFYNRFIASGQHAAVLEGISGSTGDKRLTAFHRIRIQGGAVSLPLVVAVSRNHAAIFASWYRDAQIHAAFLASAGVAALAVARIIKRRRQTIDALEESREQERIESERRLRKSEQDLATTLKSIGDAVIATDAAGRIVRMNLAAETLTGWKEDDALGRPSPEVFRIHNATTGELSPDPVQHVLKTGELVRLANNTTLTARDAKERQIADSAAPIKGKDGSTEGVVLVFSDVTEAYRVRKALAESERRLRAMFDAGPDSIQVIDADGFIGETNRQGFALIAARSSEELRLHPFIDLVDLDDRTSFALLHETVMRGQPGALEYQLTALDGQSKWVETHATPLNEASRPLMLTITRDITRRRAAQAERRALNAQLRESQKMESIGTLAGGIAHDFNNIVGGLLGHAALALSAIGHDEQMVREGLKQIRAGGLRARDLIRQILAFSRRQQQELVVQPLQPLIVEAAALLKSTLPAMVSLEFDLPEGFIFAKVDATQIEQVLINLCTNAWHAMHGSTGLITIGLTRAGPLEEPSRTDLPAPSAHLWVRDNGTGMDEATRARVFEPFFTTKPVGSGTGLGLSVVHGIVGAHGGQISVDSRLGEGSTFHIYLPLAAPPVSDDTSVDGPAHRARETSDRHVVYVDDDPVVALLAHRLLLASGFQVSVFDDPQLALEAMTTSPRRIDLIVSDYSMPGLSGVELIHRVRSVRPDLRAIITSGFVSDQLRAEAEQLGVRELLQKERTYEDLVATVQRALAA